MKEYPITLIRRIHMLYIIGDLQIQVLKRTEKMETSNLNNGCKLQRH